MSELGAKLATLHSRSWNSVLPIFIIKMQNLGVILLECETASWELYVYLVSALSLNTTNNDRWSSCYDI